MDQPISALGKRARKKGKQAVAAPAAEEGTGGAAAASSTGTVEKTLDFLKGFLGSTAGVIVTDVGLEKLENIVEDEIRHNPAVRDQVLRVMKRLPFHKMGGLFPYTAASTIALAIERNTGLDPAFKRFFANAIRHLADAVQDGTKAIETGEFHKLAEKAVERAEEDVLAEIAPAKIGIIDFRADGMHAGMRQGGRIVDACPRLIQMGDGSEEDRKKRRIGLRREMIKLAFGRECPFCIGYAKVANPPQATATEPTPAATATEPTNQAPAVDERAAWHAKLTLNGRKVARAFAASLGIENADDGNEMHTLRVEQFNEAAEDMVGKIKDGKLPKEEVEQLTGWIFTAGGGKRDLSTRFKKAGGQVIDLIRSNKALLFIAALLTTAFVAFFIWFAVNQLEAAWAWTDQTVRNLDGIAVPIVVMAVILAVAALLAGLARKLGVVRRITFEKVTMVLAVASIAVVWATYANLGTHLGTAIDAVTQRVDKALEKEPTVNQPPIPTPPAPSTETKPRVAANTMATMARELQAELCPDPDLDPDYRKALRCP